MIAKRRAKNSDRSKRVRDERGAGGLLPIVMVGMIVILVAATIASSTSFAAKISNAQVKELSSTIDTSSILEAFVANTLSTAPLKASQTVGDSGGYKVYYSTGTAAPTSKTDAGVVALGSTAPTGVKWLLVEATTADGLQETAVYKYTQKGANEADELISWTGPTSISNTTVGAAPGIQGPVALMTRANTATPNGALRINGSTVAADVYADYSSGSTVQLSSGTLSGNLSSAQKIELQNTPRVLGDIYSGSTIAGSGDIAGSSRANQSTRPMAPARTANAIGFSGTVLRLNSTNCGTPQALKTTIESITKKSILLGGEACPASSWNTSVKPKAVMVVQSSFDVAVKGLTVEGDAGSVAFSVRGNLSLDGVKYINGASGEFLSAANISVVNSDIRGSISSYGTASGNLDIANSTVLYSPTTTSIVESCGSASCTMASKSLHLTRKLGKGPTTADRRDQPS